MNYSQKNIEQLFKLIGSFPNQEFRQTLYFDYIRTTESVWPNQLINLRATETDIELVLDQIEEESETGKIPKLLMLKPQNSGYAIERIRKRNYKSNVWYAMTHQLDSIPTNNIPANFQIIQVRNESQLEDWLKLAENELMNNSPLNAAIFNQLLGCASCYFFMGLEMNKPVATSLLFVSENIAGVYFVSTKKSHRNKGYGYAITHPCITKAKELDCEAVELQATQLGKSVYKSLGFREIGLIDVFVFEKNS